MSNKTTYFLVCAVYAFPNQFVVDNHAAFPEIDRPEERIFPAAVRANMQRHVFTIAEIRRLEDCERLRSYIASRIRVNAVKCDISNISFINELPCVD